MRLIHIPLLSILNDHLVDYPTPINLAYFWSFGFLSGIFLAIQMFSGILLAMHYVPNTLLAFKSVEHIMRDVNSGWIFRYVHANGASFFFFVVYLHIARGLYFKSYLNPRDFLWFSGVVLFLLMMATGFIGYVLPWGQMSFWGATVITNLFSAIPVIGESIALWLWGGFSVGNATLNHFFSLHYLLPFLILGVVLLHLALLHEVGSTTPLGVIKLDKISFYPYFYLKDLFALLVVLLIFCIFIFFMPDALGHPDNYIEANPLVTPAHIVPEWYFLPFYAILRSIPNKLGGVICMFLAILILFFLPFFETVSIFHSPLFIFYRLFYWLFFTDFLLLGWFGAKPAEGIYVVLSSGLTIFYFFGFLIFFFLLSFEPLLLNKSYFIKNNNFFSSIVKKGFVLYKF